MTTLANTYCLDKALFYTHKNKIDGTVIEEGELVTYPPMTNEANMETSTKLYVEQKMSSTSYEQRILYSIYYSYETVPTIHLNVSKTQPFEIQTSHDTLINQGLHNIFYVSQL